MKKIIILVLFIFLCGFLSINNLHAKSTYSCDKEVSVGSYITCNVTIDNEPVKIESDGNVNIYDIKGEKYSKINDYQVVFYESGTAVFGPADDKYSKYIISLLTEDGSPYDIDTRVNVIAKTTSKATTTTTTKIKSSNNYLSTITIDGKEIEDFSKNTSKYFIEVENDVSHVSLDAIAEDENSQVEIDGPDTLEIGDNEYTISVTSENDTTKFYKIIITRKEEDESSDTDINNIKIKGYDLNFDKNSKTFYLKINEDTTKLDIDVVLNDENASFEIKGNKNLKNGSVIKILVTAEDNTTDTYRIIIQKEVKENISYAFIFIGIMIIIVIIAFILLKKRNKKNKITKKDTTKKDKNLNCDNAEKKDYQNEKTIEMPPISSDNNSNVLEEDEEEKIIHVDNDEEEKTRMLSYAEQLEMEKSAKENEQVNSMIDDEFDKTFINKDI